MPPLQRHRLGGRPMPAHLFVHDWRQGLELPANPFADVCIMHLTSGTETGVMVELFVRDS